MFRLTASFSERFAWVGLFANLLMFIYFLQRTMDGMSIAALSPRELGGVVLTTMIGLIVICIIAAIILSIFSNREGEAEIEADERDRIIEAQADRLCYYILATIITLIALIVLGDYVWPEQSWLPDLTSPPTIVVGLTVALFVSEIVKYSLILFLYRRSI